MVTADHGGGHLGALGSTGESVHVYLTSYFMAWGSSHSVHGWELSRTESPEISGLYGKEAT